MILNLNTDLTIKMLMRGGYERGRRAANPVETLLEDIWNFLKFAFNSLFGGESSQ